VRTFGCQMNEHDSERIAGQFEADGMVPAEGTDDADVIVLNTCCIRENADNKLYGTLGHLKSLKEARPGLEIVVGGCLAQKDREGIRERRPTSTWCSAPTTSIVPPNCSARHGRRVRSPRILEATTADDRELFPSALPVRQGLGHTAWVTIQIGCDNGCAFCIVPAVRGPEIQPAVRRPGGGGRAVGGRGSGRGHTAGPECELLWPRPHPGPAP